MWVRVPPSLNGFYIKVLLQKRTFFYYYGVALVSTGAIEYYNTSRRYALNPNYKLNGNIFNKVVNKVKSLFAVNCVAFA